jgi:hypothetical protein
MEDGGQIRNQRRHFIVCDDCIHPYLGLHGQWGDPFIVCIR